MKCWKHKHYECDCGTEVLLIENEYPGRGSLPLLDETLDISFFSYGHTGRYPLSIKQRIRWCWYLMKSGMPFADMIVLTRETAKELGKDLVDWSERPVKENDEDNRT